MAAEKVIPTLGPWELKLVSISNEISHSIAETMYPYKNGADLEDIGVNPESFKFSVVMEFYENLVKTAEVSVSIKSRSSPSQRRCPTTPALYLKLIKSRRSP